jgi:flagellin-specific chaperone FliS
VEAARAHTGMQGPKHPDARPKSVQLAESILRRLRVDLEEEKKKHIGVDVDKVWRR